MTREHIEFVLSEYSTDALAGKLMELFDEEAASYQHTINELNKALSKKKCGKWKRTYLDHVAMGERPSVLYCSVCCQCIAYPTNYCPKCGADMRGET